ncbi:type II secretion system F family protein [Iodobacter sp. CM08]|uniref:type II secretion system F family protein n=1 Tax=Iodobacter sp. CM08 TaxID=3085902 RepID=UPI002980CDBE|nr:type II secretion system F family protein [Iodobacter sp. CM08]MDW5418081.1 type II secretion system F family protein [Iodobacter sp. CM08]
MNFDKLALNPIFFTSQKKEDFLTDAIEELAENNKLTDYLEACRDGSKGTFSKPMKMIFGKIHSLLDAGVPLSLSIAGYFSPANQLLIETGEKNNNTAEGLKSALEINKAKDKLVSIFVAQTFHPAYMFLMALAFSALFGIMVIPNFTLAGVQVENMGKSFIFSYYLWNVVAHYSWLIFIALVSFISLSIWSLKNWHGPSRDIADKFLPHYIIYKQFQAAYLLIVISALIRNNETASEAISAIKKFSNPYLDYHLDRFESSLENGVKISQSLDTGLFASDFISRLARYQKNNRENDLLKNTGTQSFDRMARSVERAMGLVGNLIMLSAIGLIAWLGFDMASMALVMRDVLIR